MPCPSHSLDLITLAVGIIKLPTVQFSPVCYYFLPPQLHIHPQHIILNSPSRCSLLNVKNECSYTHTFSV